MIKPQLYRDAVNRYWRERSLSDDNFYFGLGDRIKTRQETKVPVAGKGTVEFLQLAGAVTAGIAVYVPHFRPVVKLIRFVEHSVRDKAGLTE